MSGRVSDELGAAVAGADVCAVATSERVSSSLTQVPGCTTSGPDGAYTLTGLFRVAHALSAAAPSFSPGSPVGDYERRVRLDRDDAVAGVNFVLVRGGVQVHGVVKDLGGGVVDGAVVLSGGAPGRGPGAIAVTDALGEFTLWVGEGEVYLRARADGYSTGGRWGVAPGMFFTLLVTPESVISGVVRDERGKPVAEALVESGGEWTPDPQYAVTDASGRYRIAGLEPGRYKATATALGASGQAKASVRLGVAQTVETVDIVVAEHAQVHAMIVTDAGQPCPGGRVTLSDVERKSTVRAKIDAGAASALVPHPGHYAIAVECDGFLAKSAYPEVDVAQDDVTLSLTVSVGRAVSGVVVDAEGHGVAGVAVVVTPKATGEFVGPAKTDVSGAFELTGLPPGTQHVHVTAEGRASPEKPTVFEIPKTGDVKPLRIVVPPSAGVRGTVTDASGHGVSGISVMVTGAGFQSRYVADDGTYEVIGLGPGEYRIVARGEQWSDSLRAPGASDDDAVGEPFTVQSGEIVEVDLVVESRNGIIEGKVVDDAAGPIADAFVSLARESERHGAEPGEAREDSRRSWGVDPILTDVEGRFSAPNLRPGSYTLRAYRRSGGEGVVEHVEVGSSGVEITVAVEGGLAGIVHTHAGGVPREFSVRARDAKSGVDRYETFAGTEGAWELQDLPPGNYELSATAREGTVKHPDVALKAGEMIGDLALTLGGLTTITGRVVAWDTAQPVAGVVVTAGKNRSGYVGVGEKHGKEMTDADGRYEVNDAPAGTVLVQVMPANFLQLSEVGSALLVATLKAGVPFEAPDIVLIKPQLGPDDEAGDLGYSLQPRVANAEPGNRPKVVAFVRPDGPAAGSGLEVGDVITEVDGHDVTGDQLLYGPLSKVPAGRTVELTLQRGQAVSITAEPLP